MGFLSTLGSLGGGLLGSYLSQKRASKEASANRHFQQSMSDTAYQRAMQDLEAAGLNPILAATNGGASTPSGATAQVPDMGAAFNGGVSNAMAASRLKYELPPKRLEAQIAKDALNLYRNEPNTAQAVQNAALMKAAGARAEVGLAKDAVDKSNRVGRWLGDKFTGGINSAVDLISKPAMRKHYEDLNRDRRREPYIDRQGKTGRIRIRPNDEVRKSDYKYLD